MNASHTYEQSVNSWRDFLTKTVDSRNGVNWGENMKYFGELVSNVLDKNFDVSRLGKTMYQHPLGGFYRWNILDGVSGTSEFEAKFHLFPDLSRTHIHSHGYEGKSTVLEGALRVHNFAPEMVGEDLSQLIKVLSSNAFQEAQIQETSDFSGFGGGFDSIASFIENFSKNPGDSVRDELSRLHKKYGIRNLTAFQQLQQDIQFDPTLIAQIEQELYEILVGEREKYSHYTGFLIHSVLGFHSVGEFAHYFFQDASGGLFRLQHLNGSKVSAGQHHEVAIQEAHCVEVLTPDTTTLFMTKKPRTLRVVEEGGEFHQFPNMPQTKNRYNSDPNDVRERILGKLREIFPQ